MYKTRICAYCISKNNNDATIHKLKFSFILKTRQNSSIISPFKVIKFSFMAENYIGFLL